ncbi:MAG TPA: thioesterase family protein [Acidimicrobiales bacterium]
MDTLFDEETAVEHLGAGRYGAVASARWGAYVGPNGGYLAALVLNAFTDTVNEPGRRVRSISLHYLEPPAFGPLEIDVSVERAGRSMTSLTGRLRQGGRAKVLATAAFSSDRRSPAFQDATMPSVPPPPELPLRSTGEAVEGRAGTTGVGGDGPAEGLEIVQVMGGGLQSGEPADIAAWVRLTEPRPLDALLAAVYVDGWYPALSVRIPEPVPAPTVDLTIHFRQHLPPDGADPTTPYLLRLLSRVAADGFVEEDAELWSPSGMLLVQSRQLEVVLRG